jgi:two-component system C4-dicarboxylate transport sensor histidine kinase DctB
MGGAGKGKRVSTSRLAELGVLAATLIHELRQPVFAIKGLAQLTRSEAGEGSQARLDQLLAQVEHLEALLDLYGTLGGRPPTMELFDANEQVQKAVEMLAHRRAKAEVDLTVHLANAPLLVQGQRIAVRQVALNLLQNAFDAVAGQDQRDVVVSTAREGGRAILEIRDNGPGVPEDIRDHLFDPFVTTKPRGSGLGLYIAWRLANEAGGELAVESADGGRTVARVSIPLVV